MDLNFFLLSSFSTVLTSDARLPSDHSHTYTTQPRPVTMFRYIISKHPLAQFGRSPVRSKHTSAARVPPLCVQSVVKVHQPTTSAAQASSGLPTATAVQRPVRPRPSALVVPRQRLPRTSCPLERKYPRLALIRSRPFPVICSPSTPVVDMASPCSAFSTDDKMTKIIENDKTQKKFAFCSSAATASASPLSGAAIGDCCVSSSSGSAPDFSTSSSGTVRRYFASSPISSPDSTSSSVYVTAVQHFPDLPASGSAFGSSPSASSSSGSSSSPGSSSYVSAVQHLPGSRPAASGSDSGSHSSISNRSPPPVRLFPGPGPRVLSLKEAIALADAAEQRDKEDMLARVDPLPKSSAVEESSPSEVRLPFALAGHFSIKNGYARVLELEKQEKAAAANVKPSSPEIDTSVSSPSVKSEHCSVFPEQPICRVRPAPTLPPSVSSTLRPIAFLENRRLLRASRVSHPVLPTPPVRPTPVTPPRIRRAPAPAPSASPSQVSASLVCGVPVAPPHLSPSPVRSAAVTSPHVPTSLACPVTASPPQVSPARIEPVPAPLELCISPAYTVANLPPHVSPVPVEPVPATFELSTSSASETPVAPQISPPHIPPAPVQTVPVTLELSKLLASEAPVAPQTSPAHILPVSVREPYAWRRWAEAPRPTVKTPPPDWRPPKRQLKHFPTVAELREGRAARHAARLAGLPVPPLVPATDALSMNAPLPAAAPLHVSRTPSAIPKAPCTPGSRQPAASSGHLQSPLPVHRTPVWQTLSPATVRTMHSRWSSPDTAELYPSNVPSPRDSQLQLWRQLAQLPWDDQIAGRVLTPPSAPKGWRPPRPQPPRYLEDDPALWSYDFSCTIDSEDCTVQTHCSPGFNGARKRELDAEVVRLRELLGMKTPLPLPRSPSPPPPPSPSPPPKRVVYCDEEGNSLDGLDSPFASPSGLLPPHPGSSYCRNVPHALLELKVRGLLAYLTCTLANRRSPVLHPRRSPLHSLPSRLLPPGGSSVRRLLLVSRSSPSGLLLDA